MECGSVTRFDVLKASSENSQPVVSVSTLRGDPSASQYPAFENSAVPSEYARAAKTPSAIKRFSKCFLSVSMIVLLSVPFDPKRHRPL